ncbi:IPT/TIG domain-containing protein [Natronosporangium hydrolyticum]|uniref:IPT/TIG domain-containing protein n=1 Tax=Natronosporangium hydrolyticum TaxID=2811111 RepID=A0A895YNF2_9ACTN|nr:IPT/TIG domain-containing protein [Natronosporangium hydrolyticum]QSB15650.1 IPT/TIG domain-containing protein [Natronosporangium hydrolyticum]
MSKSRDELWLAPRWATRRPRPAPVIDSCELTTRADGGLDVVIRGRGLRSGVMPPQIRIGGRPVRRVEGCSETQLFGVVAQGDAGDEVLVDLGPGGEVSAAVASVA